MSTTVRVVRVIPSDIIIDEMELLIPTSYSGLACKKSKTFSLLTWRKGERLKAPEIERETLQRAVVRVRDLYIPFVDITRHFGAAALHDWFKNLVRIPDEDLTDITFG